MTACVASLTSRSFAARNMRRHASIWRCSIAAEVSRESRTRGVSDRHRAIKCSLRVEVQTSSAANTELPDALLREAKRKAGVKGRRARFTLRHDARVAALCLRHGVRELRTADRDFSLFPALRVRNPLVG